MKTNFNSKTEGTIKKVSSKWLIVIISIALISLTLNAQEFDYSFFDKLNFNENNLAMFDSKTAVRPAMRNADVFLTLVETETEQSLQIENWMFNNLHFKAYDLIVPETENSLKIESWMTNEMVFGNTSALIEPATEEELEIEDWMTKDFNHSNIHLLVEEERENKLELEGWMLNTENFEEIQNTEEQLTIEKWMVSEQVWE